MILCALAVFFEANCGLLENWLHFHGKHYEEERIKARKRKIVFGTLSFATELKIASNGLLDKPGWPEPEFGQDCVIDDSDIYAYHMAYSPSSNSYRLAAIPDPLPKEKWVRERQSLYVLQVFAQSNRISKIEIIKDPEGYLSYDLVSSYLGSCGYDVHAITNAGICAFLCTNAIVNAGQER